MPDQHNRIEYTFIKRLVGEPYYRLLDYAVDVCPTISFSAVPHCGGDELRLTTTTLELFGKLKPFHEKTYVHTEEGYRPRTIFKHRYSRECAEILKPVAECIDDWYLLGLPEDLTIYRKDGSRWLEMCSREDFTTMFLTHEEHDRLVDAIPELSPALAPDSDDPDVIRRNHIATLHDLTESEDVQECLRGLINLRTYVSEETNAALVRLCDNRDVDIAHQAARYLAERKHPQAQELQARVWARAKESH